MFCPKCGTKAIEGAHFCQKCGSKLIHDAPAEQPVPSAPASTGQQSNPVLSNSLKKKNMSKVLLVVVGVLAVIAVVTIVLNFTGRTKYPDELLFNDLPATRFLEMTQEDIITELGPPDSTVFDGIDAYQQEGIYHVAYSETSGKVIYITFSTEKCTFNGKKLSTTAERALKATSSTNVERPFWRKGPISIYDEEYSVHGMFYDGGSSDIKFYSLERSEDSYTIDFITIIFDKNSNEEEMLEISLYTDEWVETVKRSGFSTEVQNAYAEKVQELAAENNDLRFALIDLTQNDVPELVADYPGYYVSVYMWVDEAVVPIMDSWPYGAFGNQGYEYLPGQNVIRNFNSDMAGAIVYESYMSVNAAHEVESLPMESLSIWYFQDMNGNGYLDEGENYSENPIHYYGDTEVSAEVYASHQIAGNYEWISGKQNAEEILSVLGVESSGTQLGERSFVMEDDEISMFTLRQDGVFTLEVNLYAGSGTLFGSYEEDGETIRCYVEVCSFEGFIGDDVSEFEMVYENGHLVYHGETVGTTVDGAIYY